MRGDGKLKDKLQNIFRLIHSGILAISSVAIIQFAPLGSSIEFPLSVSIYCLALCIPLAGIQAVLLTMEREVSEGVPNPLSFVAHVGLVAISIVFFYTGTLYMFAYFSLAAVITFAIGSSIGYALVMYVLLPRRHRYLLSALFGGLAIFFSSVILIIGYLLHDKFDAF